MNCNEPEIDVLVIAKPKPLQRGSFKVKRATVLAIPHGRFDEPDPDPSRELERQQRISEWIDQHRIQDLDFMGLVIPSEIKEGHILYSPEHGQYLRLTEIDANRRRATAVVCKPSQTT